MSCAVAGIVVHPRRDSAALLDTLIRWAEHNKTLIRGLEEARAFIAGLLAHAREITAVTCAR